MITGYEFQVRRGDGRLEWVRLQGNGGLYGAGSLAAANQWTATRRFWQRVRASLLGAARRELARTGVLRLFFDCEDPADRIREDGDIEAVEAVREVRENWTLCLMCRQRVPESGWRRHMKEHEEKTK